MCVVTRFSVRLGLKDRARDFSAQAARDAGKNTTVPIELVLQGSTLYDCVAGLGPI